jgi:hypothetical protein
MSQLDNFIQIKKIKKKIIFYLLLKINVTLDNNLKVVQDNIN